LCRQDDTDLRIKCVGRPKTIDISQNTTKDHEKIELTRLSTDISLLADVRELTSMRWNVMATFPVDLIYDTLATLSKLHLLSRSYVEEFGTVSLPNLRKIKMTFYEFYPRDYKFVVPNLRKFTAKDHVARVPQTVRLLGANTDAVIFRQCGQCLVAIQN
jgi:hypothetical protein